MDAITLLRNDHRAVEKLFKAYEKAGDGARATKRRTVEAIVRELSVHAAIEELVFYPAVRAEVEGTRDTVLESMEEHHVVKWLLSEIDGLAPDHERFDAKVSVLVENVRHHVKEEESELFPAVRAALGRKRLAEIGTALEKAKKTAPTRPHPRIPDTPPANAVVGLVAGAVDAVRDRVGV
jgi:hemerythrin superfamily protein